MNTETITIEKTTKEEIKFSIPCYRKSALYHFKIISKDESICVESGGICLSTVTLAFSLSSSQESTESEFNDAFNSALLRLEKSFHSSI